MSWFTDALRPSMALPWGRSRVPDTVGGGKVESMSGTEAVSPLVTHDDSHLNVDDHHLAHMDGNLRAHKSRDGTQAATPVHDPSAEPSSPLFSLGTTTPLTSSRAHGFSGNHDPSTAPLTPMAPNLEPDDAPMESMSEEHSTTSLAANREADGHQTQNWHYMGEAFRVMSEKHKAIVAARVRAREERKSLRRQRETVIGLDIRVADGLRKLFNTRPAEELSSLFALFEQLQKARDDLLQQEDNYNIVEDDLIGEEFDLQEAESGIFPSLPDGRSTLVDEQDITTYLDGLENLGSEGERSPEMHNPEMKQYFSRLGDEDIVKESLDELRRERAHIVEEERVRARLGLMLDKEAQDFLNHFDHRHSELQDQLARVQDDLINLQERLTSDSDIVYASNRFGNYGGLPDQAMDELEPLETSDPDLRFPVVLTSIPTLSPFSPDSQQMFLATSARSNDSLLLPDENASPVFPSPAETPEPKYISPSEYINDWLLDMLRRSPREIQRLKSTQELQRLQLTKARLAKSVLGNWSDDEDAVNDFNKQEFGARSLYISSDAFPEAAKISHSLSLPALATATSPLDGLQKLSDPLRQVVGTISTAQQLEGPTEPTPFTRLRSMSETQLRSIMLRPFVPLEGIFSSVADHYKNP